LARNTRNISWVKAAQKGFLKFSAVVREDMLMALTIAAEGCKADSAKPMKGLGAGVFEITKRYNTDTYRTVYGLKIGEDIWVVHAFKKKSKTKMKTPKEDIALIKSRIKHLKEIVK
jgi:phage-related protein